MLTFCEERGEGREKREDQLILYSAVFQPFAAGEGGQCEEGDLRGGLMAWKAEHEEREGDYVTDMVATESWAAKR